MTARYGKPILFSRPMKTNISCKSFLNAPLTVTASSASPEYKINESLLPRVF